jgi:hypothetical protein
LHLDQEMTIEQKRQSIRGSFNDAAIFKRPSNKHIKNRISVMDSNMLRERGKFLNFENNTKRADSNVKKHQYTPVSNRSDSGIPLTFTSIEENLKKRVRDVDERTVRASKRGITIKIFDEKRMSIYIQGLKELHDSGLVPQSLTQFLIEGFEDTKRRMITHEK